MTLQVRQIVPVVKLYFNERDHSLPFAVGGSRMGVRGMDKQSKIELILALALSAPLLESRPWFWAAKPAAKRTRRRTRGAKRKGPARIPGQS